MTTLSRKFTVIAVRAVLLLLVLFALKTSPVYARTGWKIENVKKKIAGLSDDELVAFIEGGFMKGLPSGDAEYRILILEIAKRDNPKLLPVTEKLWRLYCATHHVKQYWKYGYISVPDKKISTSSQDPQSHEKFMAIKYRNEEINRRITVEVLLRILAHKIVLWKKLPGYEMPMFDPYRPIVWDDKSRSFIKKIGDASRPRLNLDAYVKQVYAFFEKFDVENPEHVNAFMKLFEISGYIFNDDPIQDNLFTEFFRSPRACRMILFATKRHDYFQFGEEDFATLSNAIQPHLKSGEVVGPYLAWLELVRVKGSFMRNENGERITPIDVDCSTHEKDYLAIERRKLKAGTWEQRWALYDYDLHRNNPKMNVFVPLDQYIEEFVGKGRTVMLDIPADNEVTSEWYVLRDGGFFELRRHEVAKASLVKLLGDEEMPKELAKSCLEHVDDVLYDDEEHTEAWMRPCFDKALSRLEDGPDKEELTKDVNSRFERMVKYQERKAREEREDKAREEANKQSNTNEAGGGWGDPED